MTSFAFPRLRRTAFPLFAFALLATGQLFAQHYNRTDLTADIAATSATAPNLDPNLVNAWGLSRASGSPWWVSDNGTGLSTLYNGAGVPQALVVKIPTPDGNGTATPTGTVFNDTTGFEVAPKTAPGKNAVFIFVTEDGTIAAWNPQVNLTNAILEKDRSKNAIYKGVAIVQTRAGAFLYATNFKTGRVDIFDSTFKFVGSREFEIADDDHGRFRNYVPFNIQNVGGNLVVTFARREPGAEDEDHGAGIGLAGIFDARGHVLTRLEHGPWFNAPWGVALAPSDFGPFAHRLLIGNFGDGTINAFNTVTGKHEGTLLNPDGSTLSVDGLWALSFGGGTLNNGAGNELFFTAGPNDENNGLLGKITATNSEQRGNTE
jgi:uncharacterized protein (TIGR03118 family)